MRVKSLLVMVCVVILSDSSFAQTPARRPPNSTTEPQEQTSTQPDASSRDNVAIEISQLRKSLQTLNSRLREISEKLLGPDAKQNDSAKEQQTRISLSLDLLSRAEQRAEVLRKQLLELIEKETSLRSRLVQIEEEMRPENIERASSLVGTTRTVELRDVRRRVLDNERKGYESLLLQAAQGRNRLEEDVKQADAMVSKLRQRIFPLIEKEIDKINPNP